MSTTKDFINDLMQQQTDMAMNLTFKGIEANADEKLNALVPKINLISKNKESASGTISFSEDSTTCVINGLPFTPSCFAIANLKDYGVITTDGSLVSLFFIINKSGQGKRGFCSKYKSGSPYGVSFGLSSEAVKFGSGTITITFTEAMGIKFNAGSEYQWIASMEEIVDYASLFDITSDGIISVKSGATIPETIKIPDKINGITVLSFADNMFKDNATLKEITLNDNITTIPQGFLYGAKQFETIKNTENITVIGDNAFRSTKLLQAYFPNLTSLGVSAFQTCNFLSFADIGNVTVIPDKAFVYCEQLNYVKINGIITSIGEQSFYRTYNLRAIDFVTPEITSIGNYAFITCRSDYDWDKLSGCTFGENATSKQFNPDNFWSKCRFTPIENRRLNGYDQKDPRWADLYIYDHGDGKFLYGKHGCQFFAYMNIYCSLKNIETTSALDYAELCDTISKEKFPDKADDYLRSLFTTDVSKIDTFLDGLGLKTVWYHQWNEQSLQALYNALLEGKYIAIDKPGSAGSIEGHTVMVYGINARGELLFADSNGSGSGLGIYQSSLGKVPIQNLSSQKSTYNYRFSVVSLS